MTIIIQSGIKYFLTCITICSEPKIVFKIVSDNPKEPIIPEEIRKKFSKKVEEQIKLEKGKTERRIDHILYDTIERTVNQKAILPDQAFIFTYKVLMFMVLLFSIKFLLINIDHFTKAFEVKKKETLEFKIFVVKIL